MTQTFTRNPLSGSTDGRGIKITATSSPGVTVHTATSDTTFFDEISLRITNVDTVARPYVIEAGGTTNPDDRIVGVVLAGQSIMIDNFILRNSLVAKVSSITLTWIDGVSYAGAANVLVVHGQVLRQTA